MDELLKNSLKNINTPKKTQYHKYKLEGELGLRNCVVS